jgi:hypothetical protein
MPSQCNEDILSVHSSSSSQATTWNVSAMLPTLLYCVCDRGTGTGQQASQSVSQSVSQTYSQPVRQPASQSDSQSDSQPARQTASQWAARETVSQSVSQPVSQSARQTVRQSVSQPDSHWLSRPRCSCFVRTGVRIFIQGSNEAILNWVCAKEPWERKCRSIVRRDWFIMSCRRCFNYVE